jgi:DNA-binding NtrC family response regulator
METTARPVVPPTARTAILASADASFRQRVREALADLRWQVREAAGGAETLACLDAAPAETVVLDSWLPDLEIHEFVTEFKRIHPEVDLIMADASNGAGATFRGPRRNEVFHAIRRAQANDGTIWSNTTANSSEHTLPGHVPLSEDRAVRLPCQTPVPVISSGAIAADAGYRAAIPAAVACRLPEFVGSHPALLEVSRRIRLVAPRTTSVLIEGPTGSGKELVARALHRLSARSTRKLIALNCAAIPEGLLEAELFGHTRGAFTGAVEGRMGRIEAAHGGTLFLDEIGDMPLALQSKLLRFLESGELQRVGDNESIHADVRIVAATHRPLAMLVAKGEFRADLYYRLAVFLIRTPALKGRTQDIELLTTHFLHKFAQDNPAKQITPECLERLEAHSWPGNVRELEHVLERAWILAEERPRIDVAEIELDEPE